MSYNSVIIMFVNSNHSPDYSQNCTPLSPITITYYFGEKRENKNWKKMTKPSEEHFFHQRCKKTATNTEMAFRF